VLRRFGTWLIFASTGAGLLAGMAGTLKDGPSVVPGMLLALGAPCLLVGVAGAAWDVVKFINAHMGPGAQHPSELTHTPTSEAPQAGVLHNQVESAPPPGVDARTSQERRWDADRRQLIEEGEAVAQAVRGLVLDPNDDGFKKDLLSSRIAREAKNWIASVDEFEDHWTPSGSLINRNYLARVLGAMTYAPLVPVPRPPWRQQLVGQIEFRLDRLKKRAAPPD